MSDLLERVAELVAIPSPSHGEAALADHVQRRLADTPWLEVERIGDNVVARTTGAGTRVILAGHLDTVPPNGNEQPRIEGDVLWGLGSADMKAGLAVMLELAAAEHPPALEVTWVFYVAEEVAREHNGLLAVAAARPDLLAADAALLGEPTGAVIEAGCQGVLKAEVTVKGTRAHSARPWTGRNAIHRLGPVIERVAALETRRPVLDGCEYREALQAVSVSGGVAANVVPDEARLLLNHRFAPDRDAVGAELHLRELLSPVLDPVSGDELTVVDDHPVLARLLAATGAPPRAKLGWTDVAFFAGRGIPAANFGPGDPEVAHRADERVHGDELTKVRAVLTQLLW
jgi:succinyl-diaminopimelate desuccinylase